MHFKKYKRKGLSEMIAVTEFVNQGGDVSKVSISHADLEFDAETFNQGFIARNPANHEDMWYVSKDYHEQNLEEVGTPEEDTVLTRLIKEEKELGDKIGKLWAVLQRDGFSDFLGETNFDLLGVQHSAMLAYKRILNIRIRDLKSRGIK